MKNFGFMLILVGFVIMILTGFNYLTKEEVVSFGSIEINKEEIHPVRWSPIIGGVFLVGGFVLLITNKRKASF